MMTRFKHAIQVTGAAMLLVGASSAGAFEALPKNVPTPADNPTTAAKVELGKQLYFDPRLSIDGTVSCNSCHNVMGSGTDNRANSVGVNGQRGGRSAPTVWNSAFLSVQFWDGRADSLEDQAKGPPLNPVEKGMPSAAAVVERLNAIPGYVEQFNKAFGGKEAVSYDNMAKAIAAFERTLITRNSPFDKYLAGNKKALSAPAQRGMKLFEETGCSGCHSGPNFAGPLMPVGQGFYQKFPMMESSYDAKYKLLDDLGRYEVTKDEGDKNVWRVPSLRNIALTAPYFHNGSFQTLDEAVRVMAKGQLRKELSEKDVADIVAFLGSLSGEFPKIDMPRLPATVNSSLVGAVK